jgi:hypothetical protein
MSKICLTYRGVLQFSTISVLATQIMHNYMQKHHKISTLGINVYLLDELKSKLVQIHPTNLPSGGEPASALLLDRALVLKCDDEFGRFMCDIGNIITKRQTHPSGLMCLSARAPLFVLCVLFYLIYPRARRASAPVMMGDRARKARE